MEALKDSDGYVRRNAVTCIRELIKHANEEANKLNKFGGPAALIKYITETSGSMRLPAIVALRHYASASETNAKAIIDNNGIIPLKSALVDDPLTFVKAAAALTLGEIAKYSEEHAAPIVDADIQEGLRAVARRVDAEKRSEELEQQRRTEMKVKTKTMTKTKEKEKTKKGSAKAEDALKKTQKAEDTKAQDEIKDEEGENASDNRKEEEEKAESMAKEDLKKKVFEALGKILLKCKKHDTMIEILLSEIDDLKNTTTRELLKVVLQRLAELIGDKGDCWK